MTKEQRIEQLEIALRIQRERLTKDRWQCLYDNDWGKPICNLAECIYHDIPIRIKPQPQPKENKYLKAFREGKRVQFWHVPTNEWLDVILGCDDSDFENRNLRILTTRTVPLTYDDNLVGRVVRNKWAKTTQALITATNQFNLRIGDTPLTYSILAEKWEFVDGTPCTKQIEEAEEEEVKL